jgi:putative RNA 2'-phosphotransferase
MAKHNVEKRRDSLEKFLFYVLGVAPDEFGLLPDKDGYVPFKELLAAVRQEEGFRGVTEGSIAELQNLPKDKNPLERVGNRIRVRPEQASFERTMPQTKPKLLYLGLKPTAWPSVSERGLRPKPDEEHIRLFPTKEAALKVSSRFCPNPVILTVNLNKAESSGPAIDSYSELLYQTKELKPEALSGPPIPPRSELPEGHAGQRAELPGQSLNMAVEPLTHHGKKKGKFQDTPEWKVRTRIDRRKGKG